MKEIVCVHLLNDFSGSPLVLSGVAQDLARQGFRVRLHTARDQRGFLSHLPGVQQHFFRYRFFENKLVRLFALLWSQVELFWQILGYRKTDAVIYINTLLPFGAALAGRVSGKKVVYHLHETTVNPPVLKSFLKWVVRRCATDVIYVSEFLRHQEPVDGIPSRVVYNALAPAFLEKADRYRAVSPEPKTKFTVLMLCSLKAYKGVDVFVRLAETLPEYQFLLVLNAGMGPINQYFAGTAIPDNLVIFPAQKDVHIFYQQAHLVLNLSHPDQWVETFGMTLLEAMQYGLPVIAPPVGGPVELVTDGFNGYKIDQRNFGELVAAIRRLATVPDMYRQFSANAAQYARQFNPEVQGRMVREVVEQKKQ